MTFYATSKDAKSSMPAWMQAKQKILLAWHEVEAAKYVMEASANSLGACYTTDSHGHRYH